MGIEFPFFDGQDLTEPIRLLHYLCPLRSVNTSSDNGHKL